MNLAVAQRHILTVGGKALTSRSYRFDMPTYEYNCEKCGHSFEMVQPMSADALKTCPKELCGMKRWGKGKVKRAIGRGAGLIFKGSGFYITDYRSEGYKEAAKKDTTAATPAAPAKSDSTASPTPASTPAAAPAKSTESTPKPAKTSNAPAKSASKKA